jgi:hypothetical protein
VTGEDDHEHPAAPETSNANTIGMSLRASESMERSSNHWMASGGGVRRRLPSPVHEGSRDGGGYFTRVFAAFETLDDAYQALELTNCAENCQAPFTPGLNA